MRTWLIKRNHPFARSAGRTLGLFRGLALLLTLNAYPLPLCAQAPSDYATPNTGTGGVFTTTFTTTGKYDVIAQCPTGVWQRLYVTVLAADGDEDGDGLNNIGEFQIGTDPNNPDSDDDGLSDGNEVHTYGTDPMNADTDGDGMPDGWEVQYLEEIILEDVTGDLGAVYTNYSIELRCGAQFKSPPGAGGLTILCLGFGDEYFLGIEARYATWQADGYWVTGYISPFTIFFRKDAMWGWRATTLLQRDITFYYYYYPVELVFKVVACDSKIRIFVGGSGSTDDTWPFVYSAPDTTTDYISFHIINAIGGWLDDVVVKTIGVNPLADDASLDADCDGFTNLAEFQAGTDPTTDASFPAKISGSVFHWGEQTGPIVVLASSVEDAWSSEYFTVISPEDLFTDPPFSLYGYYTIDNVPTLANYWIKAYCDSNGNGSNDFWEACGSYAANPVYLTKDVVDIYVKISDPNTDGDGLPDWWEVQYFGDLSHDGAADGDGDGLDDLAEYESGANPDKADTDEDGLNDWDELYYYQTDPTLVDTDNGGVSDGDEVSNGTNPKDAPGDDVQVTVLWTDDEERVEWCDGSTKWTSEGGFYVKLVGPLTEAYWFRVYEMVYEKILLWEELLSAGEHYISVSGGRRLVQWEVGGKTNSVEVVIPVHVTVDHPGVSPAEQVLEIGGPPVTFTTDADAPEGLISWDIEPDLAGGATITPQADVHSATVTLGNTSVVYTITACIHKTDGAKLTVFKVDIKKPEGSADNDPPKDTKFIDTSYPYRYDWQGVCSTQPGNIQVHPIEGDIQPGGFTYDWTLPASCGTLANANTATPTHTSPATIAGESVDGELKLEALDGTTHTRCEDKRVIRIYDDHLRRDMENFVPAYLTPFQSKDGTMKGGSRELGFVCHDSTTHAYKGEKGPADFWGNWNNPVWVRVEGPDYTTPNFGILARGDIIAYYGGDGAAKHSQTCTGNGNETWGANNDPLVWDEEQDKYTNPAWQFATAPAGEHYKKAKPTTTFPITIKLFKKP